MTERGVSGQKLADHLETSRQNVSRWAKGEVGMSDDIAQRIADYFEIPVGELVLDAEQIEAVRSRPRTAPIIGLAGAGPEGSVLFAEGDGNLGDVPAPVGSTPEVKALEVRGHSMRGMAEDGWIIFYDEVVAPSAELFEELCVCWLEDGRVLIKILQRGRESGLFDLESTNAPTIRDVPVRQVAVVTNLMPRRQAQRFIRRNPDYPVIDAEISARGAA